MTPFAEMNNALNIAIAEFLADATADFGGGVTVDGEFRDPPAESFGMVSGHKPSFEASSSALSIVVVGTSVSINGMSYTVSEMTHRAGRITLMLEAV